MDKVRGLPREQKMLGVAGAMVLFLISLLFLKWFGIDDFSVKATKVFDSWILALLLAIVAGGIFAAEALNISLPVKWATVGVGALAAFLVLFWTLTHVWDADHLKFGAWLALIVSIIGSGLALLVWNEERT